MVPRRPDARAKTSIAYRQSDPEYHKKNQLAYGQRSPKFAVLSYYISVTIDTLVMAEH
jgi:hypothetical protein